MAGRTWISGRSQALVLDQSPSQSRRQDHGRGSTPQKRATLYDPVRKCPRDRRQRKGVISRQRTRKSGSTGTVLWKRPEMTRNSLVAVFLLASTVAAQSPTP